MPRLYMHIAIKDLEPTPDEWVVACRAYRYEWQEAGLDWQATHPEDPDGDVDWLLEHIAMNRLDAAFGRGEVATCVVDKEECNAEVS